MRAIQAKKEAKLKQMAAGNGSSSIEEEKKQEVNIVPAAKNTVVEPDVLVKENPFASWNKDRPASAAVQASIDYTIISTQTTSPFTNFGDCAVIDPGSYMMRAGFAGEEAPKTMFRTIMGAKDQNCFIGNEAIQNEERFQLYMSKPYFNGDVKYWDKME